MKPCIGIISWLPDNQPNRAQRIARLDKTFNQLHTIFGDIPFLIIAQNWKDYSVPTYVKDIKIINKPKLGILNARKTLREEFLKTSFDYLIMADDDIILQVSKDYSGKQFLNDLESHPTGFAFVRYGWSLTFCAVSRWIYEQQQMVDVDPEKEEGYEDTTFPNLLHYKFPKNEFKIKKIDFLQHKAEYHRNHASTWEGSGHNKHDKLKFLTDYYIQRFKQNDFEVTPEMKNEALYKWENRPKTFLEQELEQYTASKMPKIIANQKLEKNDFALPSLNEYLD